MSSILYLLLPILVAGIVEMVLSRLTEAAPADKQKTEKFMKRASADDIVDAAPTKRYKARQEHPASGTDSLSPLSQRVASSEIPVFDEQQSYDIAEFTDRNEMHTAA